MKIQKISKIKYLYDQYIDILPNPDQVSARTGKSYEAFRKLKADPHVWSSIQQRKSGVLSLDSKIVNEVENKKLENEIWNMLQIINIKKLTSNILEAPLYGFQPLEIIWELIDNHLQPIKVEAIKQENFIFDSYGKIKYLSKGNNKPQPVPKYKILNAQYESTNINPYGESLLSKCYWLVQFKYGTIRNWVSFTDKFGSPFLIGKYNTGATQEEMNALAEEISKMVQDEVIIYPNNMDIDLKELTGTISKEIYKGLTDFCNSEISKALLSQTLTTQIDTGSYAAANVHYKIKREVTEGDIQIVEQTINTLIKYYLDVNYDENIIAPKYKIIFTNADNAEQIKRDIEIDKTRKLSQKYWEREYNLSPDDFENKVAQ